MLEDINKQYANLAAQLGDVVFKLHLLELRKQELVAAVNSLNQVKGFMPETRDSELQKPKD